MPVKINGATNGSVTLAAPDTGSDVTLTLPAAAGTVQTVPGAWTEIIPTWTAGAGAAIGNGSMIARYSQVGKIVHVRYRIVYGSTTNFGAAANWIWSLPVSAYFSDGVVGHASMFDTSTSTVNQAQANLLNASTFWLNFSATSNYAVGTAAPWTWATDDYININLTYEAA